MQSKKRFALALVIMLSGLLLVPFVALPKESFRWQLFAGAYGSDKAMGSNYEDGGPGSYFLISGFGFTPGATAQIKANGNFFGTVKVNSKGEFTVLINSAGASPGRYVISADEGSAGGLAVTSASTSFDVISGAPVRAPVEADITLTLPNVPAGLGDVKLWMPLVWR